MNLLFGNHPADMLDEGYFGFGEFYPDDSPAPEFLSSSEIRVRDRFTSATVSLFGSFIIQSGELAGGTVNRMTWKTASSDFLLDLSNFSLPLDEALEGNLLQLFDGNNTVTGGAGDDILIGLPGNDLIRGGFGKDMLIASSGQDTIFGGADNDILIAADEPAWNTNLFVVSSVLLSGNGQYMVFQGEANLFGYSAEPGEQAFYRGNIDTFVIERVVGPFESGAIFDLPVLSDDGTRLAFIGPASLAGEQDSGYPQLLLADLETLEITVVSRTPEGSLAGYLPDALAISGDGKTIAFVYLDSDLVADDTNGFRDIFVKRSGSDTIERASVTQDGVQANGSSWFPSLSADGQLLAFASVATNLTPDSTPEPAAYVRNLNNGEREWIATLANPSSFAFDIGPSPLVLSANGRFLAFVSNDDNLVSYDSNGVADVFVRDLVSGETVRASEDIDGFEGQYYSSQPAISGDGRYVAFITQSTWDDELLYDGNFRADVFVKDLFTGTLNRIPTPGFDGVGSGPVSTPQLSFNGGVLAYHYASDAVVLALLDESGVHVMNGEAGDDFYILLRTETVEESANDGFDVVVALFSSPYVLPENLEALVHPVAGSFEGSGNDSDNRFLGGAGDESWNGAGGIDVLTFQALYNEVTVAREADHWVLSNPISGRDALHSIERVEFNDIGLALDTGGNAGAAFALLYAGLGEVPDPVILAPWIFDFDAGNSSIEVAQHILDFYSAEFPAGIPNDALVSTLWPNIVSSPIPQSEFDYYVGLLNSNEISQAELFSSAAQHPLNQANIEPLIAAGIFYQSLPFQWNTDVWGGTFF